MIVALTVFAIGCILGSVGLFIRPGTGHFVEIGNLFAGVDSYTFNFYWRDKLVFSKSQILVGSILILPSGIYIVRRLVSARKQTVRGFPVGKA